MVCVLIVDDDSRVRSTLRQNLEAMGHCVRDACDGRKALAIADKHRPDIAIVDILMPEMDGIETIREFRRKHYRFPIIAMPAHGTTKRNWYGDIARMFGADDVLVKPFTPTDVEKIVSRFVKQDE